MPHWRSALVVMSLLLATVVPNAVATESKGDTQRLSCKKNGKSEALAQKARSEKREQREDRGDSDKSTGAKSRCTVPLKAVPKDPQAATPAAPTESRDHRDDAVPVEAAPTPREDRFDRTQNRHPAQEPRKDRGEQYRAFRG